MRRLQRSYIFLAYSSLLIQGLADNIRGPLFPDILQEFHLDNRMGSLFFSLSSALIIVGGFLGGRLLESLGRIKTLQVGSSILLFSLLGIYFSPSFPWMLVAVFFLGISFGSIGVAQNVMVIEASPPQDVQKWQSGLQSMYGLASLTAPLLVSLLHVMGHSWRDSFLLAAVLTGVLIIGSFFGQEAKLTKEVDPLVRRPTSRGEIMYFGSIIASYVVLEVMVSTRLAQFTREVMGWDFSTTGTLNSLFFVGMFSGRLLIVFWRPNLKLKFQMIISLAASTVAVLIGIFINPIGLAISGIAMAPFYPICMTLAGRLFPKELGRIAGTGVALSGLYLLLMQSSVGFLADQFGLRISLIVGPVFGMLTLLLIVFYQPLFQRDLNAKP